MMATLTYADEFHFALAETCQNDVENYISKLVCHFERSEKSFLDPLRWLRMTAALGQHAALKGWVRNDSNHKDMNAWIT